MEVIYEGRLNKGEIPFTVLPLSLIHLKQILRLQEKVIDSLEKKEILQPLTVEEFKYILEGNGFILGVFVDNQLIALRALLVPLMDQDHLGRDIGLVEEELANVIYQEISIVHPDYRGNRLQQTLASMIMEELSKQNRSFSYICCTVAPFNIPSLKDKFAQGMEIASLKKKYGDRLRYIFVKKITDKNDRLWTDRIILRMDDIAGQQKLLAEGWLGIGMEERGEKLWVIYRRS